MTRKQLEDLGVTKEQADSIMKINSADIEDAKEELSAEIKNFQAEVGSLKNQVKERDTQLESLKGSAGDNEALKQQIADLQKANTDAATAHESEMNRLKIDFAVDKALTGAKAKNIKAARALLDLTDARLDKEGNVKGLKEQIDRLSAADDTKFLFEDGQQLQKNTFRGFQPGVSANQKPGAEADFSKMSYEELAAYMEDNPEN